MKRAGAFVLVSCLWLVAIGRCDTSVSQQDATVVWQTLWQPAMDPEKSAHVENIEIVRDRIHIVVAACALVLYTSLAGVRL